MKTDDHIAVHGFSRAQRAERIDAALATYCPLLGYLLDREKPDELTAAGLLADLHHWCDLHGYDFAYVVETAALFWRDET